MQLPGGDEVRFRVAGVVRALENDGRVAYVRADRAARGRPRARRRRSRSGSRPAPTGRAVDRAAARRSARRPPRVGGATTRNAQFLGVLAAVLRGVGLAVGLVCLYALVQALAMTARERRGAVALLRACRRRRARPSRSCWRAPRAAVALPAALAGRGARAWSCSGRWSARLAAGFADARRSRPAPGRSLLVVAGPARAARARATALVARRVLREPIVAGLREE